MKTWHVAGKRDIETGGQAEQDEPHPGALGYDCNKSVLHSYIILYGSIYGGFHKWCDPKRDSTISTPNFGSQNQELYFCYVTRTQLGRRELLAVQHWGPGTDTWHLRGLAGLGLRNSHEKWMDLQPILG